jgi:hypothetical protein
MSTCSKLVQNPLIFTILHRREGEAVNQAMLMQAENIGMIFM